MGIKFVYRLGSYLCFLGVFLMLMSCGSSAPAKSDEKADAQEKTVAENTEEKAQEQPADEQSSDESTDEQPTESTDSEEGGIIELAGGEEPVAQDDLAEAPAEETFAEEAPIEEVAADSTQDQAEALAKETSDPEARLRALENRKQLQEKEQDAFVGHLVRTAKESIARHEYNKAKLFLDRARELDPANPEVRRLGDQVGGLLGDNEAQIRSLADVYDQEVKVKIEQAKLEARNHFREGKQYLREREYDKSIHSFESCLEIIKWAPYQLNLEALRRQADIKIKEANATKEKWLAHQRRQKMIEAQREAELLETEEQKRKQTQVRILLNKATEYFTRKKFDESETLVKEILEIDPINKTAKRLQQDILDTRHSHIAEATLKRKIEAWKVESESLDESFTPYHQDLMYPDAKRWHEVISQRVSATFSKDNNEKETSPIERDIITKLESTPITLNFNETPFQDVIRFIQTTADINIVVDPKVIQNFQIEGTKVTLNVTDLKLKTALNILLQFHNLIYLFRNDVLFITSKNSQLAKGKASPRLHDIRDLTGQIKDFPGPQIRLLEAQGEEAGTAVFEEEAEGGGPVLTGEKLTELIKISIAPDSWEKDENSVAETSGQLLVVNTDQVQDEIHKFLQDLRRFSGMMVAIESRFINVTDDFLENVGVDWRGIGEGAAGNNDQNVLIPALDRNEAGGFNDNNGEAAFPAAGFFFNDSGDGKGDIRARTENIDNQGLGSRLNETGGLTLNLAFLDDIQLNMILRAIKKDAQVEVMTAPRLTTFNTQRSNITVVNQISYIRDFDVEVAQSAYIADPVIGIVQDGVVLDVRPTISNDRRYVTLELRPTVADLKALAPFETFLGGQVEVVFFQPELELQSIETSVRVPDRGTILLGGLKTFRQEDRKQDIPVLGDLPVLGFFFSQRKKIGRTCQSNHLGYRENYRSPRRRRIGSWFA